MSELDDLRAELEALKAERNIIRLQTPMSTFGPTTIPTP
jgi:hypothetical protein